MEIISIAIKIIVLTIIALSVIAKIDTIGQTHRNTKEEAVVTTVFLTALFIGVLLYL